MISKSLFVILLLLISFLPQASGEEIRWGLKGGFNFGYFNSEIGPWQDKNALSLTGNLEPFNTSPRFGISGGLVMNYTMDDVFGFYTEILYSPKGSTYQRQSMNVMQVSQNGGTTPVKEIIKYALDYIELPLGVFFQPHKRFNFKIGIAPAFNVSSRIKSNYWETDEDNDLMNEYPFNNVPGTPVEEEFDKMKFDFAKRVIFSTSLEINYNTRKGYFFLNFSRMIGNVYNMEKMNGYNMETQNNVTSIGFTYLLPD